MRIWEGWEAQFGSMGVVRLAREHQKSLNCALKWAIFGWKFELFKIEKCHVSRPEENRRFLNGESVN